MEFKWDDAKSERCRVERGFSFATVIPAFSDPDRIIEDDLRYEYGEPRFKLYGRVEGRLFVIAFTIRDTGYRIISARKANKREVRRYGQGKTES